MVTHTFFVRRFGHVILLRAFGNIFICISRFGILQFLIHHRIDIKCRTEGLSCIDYLFTLNDTLINSRNFNVKKFEIVGSSPELLVKVERDSCGQFSI